MKLHELIKTFEAGTTEVNLEHITKYKRSLLTYYRNYYIGEPIVMVTSVFNAGALGMIVPAAEFGEALDVYLAVNGIYHGHPDYESEYEIINANSIFLKNL